MEPEGYCATSQRAHARIMAAKSIPKVGVPFWIAGLLVLATLPFAWGLATSLPPESPASAAVLTVSSADVTGEFSVEKVAEEQTERPQRS